MTPLTTLTELRKHYPTPMSAAQLGELLNAVAWTHRAEGYGLLSKFTGGHTTQPQTGQPISRDILMLKDSGRIFDVLIDAEGKAEPTWGEKKALNSALWVAPVDAGLPPTTPDPPPVPPVSHAVYPDENTWWKAFEAEQEALYTRAGRGLDWAAFRWSARTAFDIGAGMDKEQAKANHLAELRAALGLP